MAIVPGVFTHKVVKPMREAMLHTLIIFIYYSLGIYNSIKIYDIYI